jgi:hypothetical protein
MNPVKHRSRARWLAAAALAAGLLTPLRADGQHADGGALEMYTATVDTQSATDLVRGGYDVASAQPAGKGLVSLQLVLSPRERAVLDARGVKLALWRAPGGRTATELADAQAQEGFKVWKPYDGTDGVRDWLYAFTRANPGLTKLEVLGTSNQDREIIAVKVTKDAQTTPDGSRPAVLYSALQHAREWIALEVDRRLMVHFVEHYATDPEIQALVDSNEFWFVIVANPDGYQYTHTNQRLWRKNTRDNNGDGVTTSGDGVDLNRNFDNHWGHDNEGSSSASGSDVWRGPEPASEPETQAMQNLLLRLRPAFQLNYHSVASLILYDQGWQVDTPTPDNPIFRALAGDWREPAVAGYVPEISADLYITNGETCDFAIGNTGTLCFTPELSDAGSGGGFVFPDDEALVQSEFEKNLPFALDIARSAADPAHPVSHLGNTVKPMLVDTFPVSYGDPQPVEVNAARHLGDVTLKFRINDDPEQSAPAKVWQGGERYGGPGHHYQTWRGEVTGAKPGDRVAVRFEAGGVASEPFTYTLASDSGAPVLVVAAEDYTGPSPVYAKTEDPSYLAPYVEALSANGIEADVYDVDARGRTAPSPLGVLGHYRAVIWYTGDDIVTREPGMTPGTASRLASDLVLAMRQFLNEGGRLLHTGKYAGFAVAQEEHLYDPEANANCGDPDVDARCKPLSNDFNQYYLGLDSYQRTIDTPIDLDNLAGEKTGWWGGRSDNADNTVGRGFDLSQATAPVTLAFDSYWGIEPDYDYGYVEVSTNGGADWTGLRDQGDHFTDTNPNGGNRGWGLTGAGEERLRFDLSAYAGLTETLEVRLVYATDGGVVHAGWWVDNLTLDDAKGRLYANDLDTDFSDWTLDGWAAVPPPPPTGTAIYSVTGTAPPFDGLAWQFGAPGATNQDHSAAGVPTSRNNPVEDFPQFRSWNAAFYDDPARGPHSGDHAAYSGTPGKSYQRLTRTIDMTRQRAGNLNFWVNHDIHPTWDAVFVEARSAGGEDWTTLPDRNGHTSPDTALNCANAFFVASDPHLAHYMTTDASGADPVCKPTGTTGAWHAANGRSEGWQEWSVDLAPFAGKEVEISIAYLNWTGSTGVFIDDLRASTDAATVGFEDGTADVWGGWSAADAPAGSAPNPSPFQRSTRSDYPAGAVVVTEDTIFFGFGFEGIATAAERKAVMGRAVSHLLRPERVVYLPAVERW